MTLSQTLKALGMTFFLKFEESLSIPMWWMQGCFIYIQLFLSIPSSRSSCFAIFNHLLLRKSTMAPALSQLIQPGKEGEVSCHCDPFLLFLIRSSWPFDDNCIQLLGLWRVTMVPRKTKVSSNESTRLHTRKCGAIYAAIAFKVCFT